MTTRVRTPKVNGLRFARDTFRHGLRTEGPALDGTADIVRLTFNRHPLFVVRHPDHVDHVLRAQVDRYRKSVEYETLRAVLGLSLFTDEGGSWRRHRTLIGPVLARPRLADLFELMVDPVDRLLTTLDRDGDRFELEMAEAMTALTLDVVGSALFGRGMADLARRIGPNVTAGLRGAERATRTLLIADPPAVLVRAIAAAIRHSPVLPRRQARMREVMRTIDETVWGVITDRRAEPGRADDLLGLLLSVRDADGRPLPLKRVRDEAATFMLAGHETTANALSWMWYLLATNPGARNRLLAEVDEVLGDRRPVFADLPRLAWTTACFMEAMRLYPPAWSIPRRCVIGDDIAGHSIPRGSRVIIPIYAVHRDPRWWPAPETFDPGRFLPGAARQHHRAAYLPFGGGRRVCAGQHFAVIEATLLTAMLSRRYTFDQVPGFPVEPEATLTLRPRHGLRMIARRRLGSS
ncbi:cytochrome P450 [Actinomadura napierensis]